MRVYTQRSTAIVLVCAVVCVPGTFCRAESADPDKPAQPILTVLENPPPTEDVTAETPEDRIRHVLKSRVRVEMTDVPLAAFARELGERLGIPVVLRRWAIEELDLGDEVPLSFSTRGMSAATMLRRLLEGRNLGWLVEDEALTITTLEEVVNHRITRIYDVSDLVTVYREDGAYDFDFQTLIHLLTNNVRYITWQEYGGEGDISHYEADYLQVIVVWNTIEVHEELKGFLSMLRAHLPAEPPDPVKRQERAKAIEATEPKPPKSTEDERPINNSPVPPPSPETASAGQIAPENPCATDATPSIILEGMNAASTDAQPRSAGVASLERTLTSNVYCNRWEAYGGEGRIEPFQVRGTQLLVITQTSEMHDLVGRWLEELRKVRREGNGLPMPKTRFIPRTPEIPPGQGERVGGQM